MTFKPYYYCYVFGKSGPTRRHATFAEAKAEAERLAVKENRYVEILKALAYSRVSAAETVYAEDATSDGTTEPTPKRGGSYCSECGSHLYHHYTLGWICPECLG